MCLWKLIQGLHYIEGVTGQQYINTGFVLSESDTIEAYYDYVD